MLPRKTQPSPPPRQALGVRPIRNEAASVERREDGSARVTVPLKSNAFGRLLRLPAGATKSFELDALGLFVWDRIDGRASLKRIVRDLAAEWRLDPRAAEVSTLAFLRTLTKRGLIGVAEEAGK